MAPDTCDCSGTGFIGDRCQVAPCGVLGVACPAGFGCTARGTCESASEIFVPAGRFWMGCNAALDTGCAANELAQHEVTLSAYGIDKTEVTAAAYQGCVQFGLHGFCEPPAVGDQTYATYGAADKQDHPINYVSWDQAAFYCATRGRRLCTEAEWERAARGGCETIIGECESGERMRVYPWDTGDGSAPLPPTCNRANWPTNPWPCEPATHTSAAGSHPSGASPYGAQDMVGNVVEWVADWYHGVYSGSSANDPAGPTSGLVRVIRGWGRASERYPGTVLTTINVGFRCCRSITE